MTELSPWTFCTLAREFSPFMPRARSSAVSDLMPVTVFAVCSSDPTVGSSRHRLSDARARGPAAARPSPTERSCGCGEGRARLSRRRSVGLNAGLSCDDCTYGQIRVDGMSRAEVVLSEKLRRRSWACMSTAPACRVRETRSSCLAVLMNHPAEASEPDRPQREDVKGEHPRASAYETKHRLRQRLSCDVDCDATPSEDRDLLKAMAVDGGQQQARKLLRRRIFVVIGRSR
jgi:hypothetical protein